MADSEALVRGLLESARPSELDAVQIPEVVRLKDVPQDPKHHPEGSAYVHTMQVLDRAASLRTIVVPPADQLVYMLAAWLHDVGKWESTFYRGENRKRLVHWSEERPKDTRIVSYGHDSSGARIVPAILKRELEETKHGLIPHVQKLVEYHMRPLLLRASKLKAYRKVADSGVDMELLGILNWADKGKREESWWLRIKELEDERAAKPAGV